MTSPESSPETSPEASPKASTPQPVVFYLAIAGLITLTLGVAVACLTGTFDRTAGIRYFGILMGLLMVVAGNALPKLPRPGGTQNALRVVDRLAGWVFVLGGLGVIGLWVWVPEAGRIVSTSVAGLAIFAVVLLAALVMTRGQSSAPAVSAAMRGAVIKQRALFHILHAVMWVFAIFLASELWHGNVVGWLSAGFATSLIVLDTCLAAPLRRSGTQEN